MEMIPISEKRMSQLEEYAHRHGQDAASALDVVLAEYLAWERRDFREAVDGIREGYEDLKAGRTQPVEDVVEELRGTHGLPR